MYNHGVILQGHNKMPQRVSFSLLHSINDLLHLILLLVSTATRMYLHGGDLLLLGSLFISQAATGTQTIVSQSERDLNRMKIITSGSHGVVNCVLKTTDAGLDAGL